MSLLSALSLCNFWLKHFRGTCPLQVFLITNPVPAELKVFESQMIHFIFIFMQLLLPLSIACYSTSSMLGVHIKLLVPSKCVPTTQSAHSRMSKAFQKEEGSSSPGKAVKGMSKYCLHCRPHSALQYINPQV